MPVVKPLQPTFALRPVNPKARGWRWRAVLFACCVGLTAPLAQAQGLAEQGFRIITTGSLGNCVACHAVPGQAGVASTFGPSLAQVGSRYSAPELRQWVSDARKIKPDTLMPPFATTQGTRQSVRAQAMLDEVQIDHVVAALSSLK